MNHQFHLADEEIESLKIDGLKNYLRRHGQLVTGNKKTLIERAKGVRKLNLRDVLDVELEENIKLQKRWTEKLTTPLGETIPDPNTLKAWSSDTRDFPDVTDKEIYNYLVLTMKSKRQMRSKVYYEDGHVHSLLINSVNKDCSHCIVKAKVIPSLPSKNQNQNPDHEVWICLSKVTSKIHSANCDCTAGEGEACNHVGALLYALEDLTTKKRDGTISCTSNTNLWILPRKRKMSPIKAQDINFRRGVLKEHKKSAEKSSENDVNQDGTARQKGGSVTDSSVNEERDETVEQKGGPLHVTGSSVNEERFRRNLEKINSNAGWLLFFGKTGVNGTELPILIDIKFNFNDSVDLNSEKCKEFFLNCFESLEISEEECVTIDRVTKGQSTNLKWKEGRSQRLTSSYFGNIYSRKENTKPDNLIRNMMYTEFDNIHLKWGRNHEPSARRIYANSMAKQHDQFCLVLSGLLVNCKYPHLGSSPDGLISCTCCGQGLLEVKCPSSEKWKFQTPKECALDRDFFCHLDENNNLSLKQTHKYFFQVQGQMAISGRKYCDFVVWTLKGHSVQRIKFESDLWDEMLIKLNKFYLESMLPELFSCRIQRGIPLHK